MTDNKELDEYKNCTSRVYSPNQKSYQELEKQLENFNETKKIEFESLQSEIAYLKKKNIKHDWDQEKIRDLEKIIRNQETVINFAVGYISATQNVHSGKTSPEDIKKWLYHGVIKN